MDTCLRHFILRSSIVPVLISRWLFGGNAAAPFRTLMHDDLTAHHNNLVINSVRLSGYRLSFRHPCLAINETIENVIGTIEVELRSTARRLYQTHPADVADHKKIEKYNNVFLTTTTNHHLPRADNPTRLCTLPWKHRWKFRALSCLTV